jgi:hypothetical protein
MARDVRSIQFGREVESEPDVDEVTSWLPVRATDEEIQWVAKVLAAGDMPVNEAFKLWILRFDNPFRSDETPDETPED